MTDKKLYTIDEIAEYFETSYELTRRKLLRSGIKISGKVERKSGYSSEVFEKLYDWKPQKRLNVVKEDPTSNVINQDQLNHLLSEIKTLHAKCDAIACENSELEQKVSAQEYETSGLVQRIGVLETWKVQVIQVLKMMGKRLQKV